MTHREAFLRINAFEPVDWFPNYELGAWGQAFERWTGEGMPDSPEFICNWFDGAPGLGLDGRAFAPVSTGMIPGFDYEVIEETERYIVARSASGIVTRALKEGTVRGTRWCMDEYIGFPVTDRASFRALKSRYDPATPARYPANWDELRTRWAARDYPLFLQTNGNFGFYSQLRSWAGTLPLSYMFYDDPTLIEEMVEFLTDFFLATVERALQEVEFDCFNFFEDLAGKGGPLISPDLFRRFLLPGYKGVIGRLNQAGIKHIWVDSDGDSEPLIPLWLEAGVTGHWPLEQASGMEPLRLRREYGRDLFLAGGIDKLEIAKGRDAIDRELESKLPPLLESGGYIPFLDHTFPPDISYDSLQYYLEVKRRLIEAAGVRS
jgi:uroporphyrinogen decarboxylase